MILYVVNKIVIMQNTSNSLFINNKIINIQSEVLFREAEDDFFYFNKINEAKKKLEKALELTPSHLKTIMLLADILFIKGSIKKALNLYLQAFNIKADLRIYASLANCYNALGNHKETLKYCDKALNHIYSDNLSLFSQVTEIKIEALINLGDYNLAYTTFLQAQNALDSMSLDIIHSFNYDILREKIQKRNKLHNSYLRIV